MTFITLYNETLKNLFSANDRILMISNLSNIDSYRFINRESFDKNLILIYNLYSKWSGGIEFNRSRELQQTLMHASAKGDPDTTSSLTEIQEITNQLLESQKSLQSNVAVQLNKARFFKILFLYIWRKLLLKSLKNEGHPYRKKFSFFEK